MKNKFRIIELPTHQVLLIKDFDDDEESTPLLTVTFFIDGVKVNQKLGYSNEEIRDDYFDKFTEHSAQDIINATIEMLS